jgi:hypothetical protein
MNPTLRTSIVLKATSYALLLVVLAFSRQARGAGRDCDGPEACCPTTLVDHPPGYATVQLGVLLVGLYEVEERSGTWKADFYLNESWIPTPGFSPRTEIVNEVERQGEQFDNTELENGHCVRTRRIHSTLHTNYNLRAFPFDRQKLLVEFSDAWFSATDLRYSSTPSVSELDECATNQLSSWKTLGALKYAHQTRRIRETAGITPYDYATFSLEVRRHVSFHLTRFFLPLLVIVLIALTVFWIDPLDLSSKVSIGVTCLLSAIALQFAEGGTLPEVEYLTLADRVFASCYMVLALALIVTVRSTALAKTGQLERASKLDKKSRAGFPVGLMLALAACVVKAFVE